MKLSSWIAFGIQDFRPAWRRHAYYGGRSSEVTSWGDRQRTACLRVMRLLAGALLNRWRIGLGVRGRIVLPLHDGAGAFVRRSVSRQLVSTLTRADAETPLGGLVGWLQKRQARRSVLLVVPDRPCGVAVALRLGLSPERFRLAADYDPTSHEASISTIGRGRPWYSRG